MPPVGFETKISAGERPKTYALDRAATGIGVNLYMFRAYPDLSSVGTTVYIYIYIYTQQLLLIVLFRWLSVVLVRLDRTADSHLKLIIITNCCIRTVGLYLLMMGLDTPETCRGWRNLLRISCALSWFFFTRLPVCFPTLLLSKVHDQSCSLLQQTLTVIKRNGGNRRP